jgi:anion-transporting  ArsA/GET3 family ATPase
MSSPPGGLLSVLGDTKVVICAGPGGVGKTTTAAAIGVAAARAGKRACVVTIDPAKRLADALGLESLTNEPNLVAGDWPAPGELWALMLDTKSTFDTLVARYAASEEQARTILANRFYRNISGALSGTQEYMAVEKLYELHESSRFDLVVVDTPPTRQALDFVDAPRRLTRFLNNRIFRMLMMPTRAGLRAVNVATQLFLRTVSKVVGGEVVAEAVAFFTAFEGMEQGFRDRTDRVEALLQSDLTAFVLVAAPRGAAVAEAVYFADKLAGSSLSVSAVIVNRLLPRFAHSGTLDTALAETGIARGQPTGQRADGALACASEDGIAGFAALVLNLSELDRMAESEDGHLQDLAAHAPGAALVRVPFLAAEVHDLTGLGIVADHLTG